MSIGKFINQFAKEQRRERVAKNYTEAGRFIRTDIYNELKARRKCQNCGKQSTHSLEIHHKKAVSDGGSNERENLLAVCKTCHELLDAQQRFSP